MTRWKQYAKEAGRILAHRDATMDDYRMRYASACRYGADLGPAVPLAFDRSARWWARWLPWA